MSTVIFLVTTMVLAIIVFALVMILYGRFKKILDMLMKYTLAISFFYIVDCLSIGLTIMNIGSIFDSYWYSIFLLLSLSFQYYMWAAGIKVANEQMKFGATVSCILLVTIFPITVIWIDYMYVGDIKLSDKNIVVFSVELGMLLALLISVAVDEHQFKKYRNKNEQKVNELVQKMLLEIKSGISIGECVQRTHKDYVLSDSQKYDIYMRLNQCYFMMNDDDKEKDNVAYHKYLNAYWSAFWSKSIPEYSYKTIEYDPFSTKTLLLNMTKAEAKPQKQKPIFSLIKKKKK